MKLVTAGLSDPGKVRTNNEDACRVDEGLGLLLVADGMGGHAAGEVASQMAVQVIHEQVEQGLKTGKIPALEHIPHYLSDRARLLDAAVQMANEVIHTAAKSNIDKNGMGTTVVAALVHDRRLSVAHVGDSRIYILHQEKLRQLTRDHSLVAEQMAKGLMTAAEAEHSDIKNVLTRALGIKADVEIDVDEHPLVEGDVILLCSDGLCRMVSDEAIEKELNRLKNPVEMCQNLVQMALDQGGKDNVTVVVARVAASGWRAWWSSFWKSQSRNGFKS